MISSIVLHSNRLTLLCMLTLIFGCTHTYKQPIHDFKLSPPDDRLNIPIELMMTEELQSAEWTIQHVGNTANYPLRENIIYHTESMMYNIFSDLRINYNPNIDLSNEAERYLMIPKIVYFGHARGATFSPETKTSITMQWQIVKKTGEHIWVETITGTHVGTYKEASIEKSFQQAYKQALMDLLQKSQEEILSSRLLRSLQPEGPNTVVIKRPIELVDEKNEHQK